MDAGMFRPPINRAMRTLDRSFFQKRIPISAARVHDPKNISKCRKELEHSREILQLERLSNVQPDPSERLVKAGGKCVLLRPEVRHDDVSTWSAKLSDLVRREMVGVVPFDLDLQYDYWTYRESSPIQCDPDLADAAADDIISAILPEDELGEVPSGFNLVGHVAHLNLRDAYLPYKHILGAVILDKNSGVRSVINKIDDVGEENAFRTFNYEVIAGEDDMNVEVKEGDCLFRFNYAKVYWNGKLNTEHERLRSLFKEGEAVCDVMAGIGPFAVPAGKKGVFVWANDLNPESFAGLQDAIKRNK
ncbi:hypothetical protein LTR28_000682, partial [Elasticomyces elasticus]